MATIQERLADSLMELQKLQNDNGLAGLGLFHGLHNVYFLHASSSSLFKNKPFHKTFFNETVLKQMHVNVQAFPGKYKNKKASLFERGSVSLLKSILSEVFDVFCFGNPTGNRTNARIQLNINILQST